MTPAAKEYTRDLLIVMVLYVGSVVGINMVPVENMGPTLRIALSLIPLIPTLLMVFVILRFVRKIDEVQQRIINEACLVSLVVVGLTSFAYGFLEGAVDLPTVSPIWVFPALIGTAGAAIPFVRMRYV